MRYEHEKKERDITSSSFFHYEKHYLLNNTITCALSLSLYVYKIIYKSRAKL